MPQEVNFGISASYLQVGYVLSCAVSSVEDNGFVMDTGIANIRGAFLKNTAIDGSGRYMKRQLDFFFFFLLLKLF